MERTQVLDMMSGLKLHGMRSAYDETLATAIKRKHEPQRFVGDLLKAEILREAGALDQAPARRHQAAAPQSWSPPISPSASGRASSATQR